MSGARSRFSFRRLVAIGGVLFALAALAFRAWWLRPLVSDAIVAEVGAIASDEFVAARRTACPRPVLRGTAIPGDGTAELRTILAMDGRFGRCFATVGVHADALEAALTWVHNETELRAESEMVEGTNSSPEWSQVLATRPLSSLRDPSELAILADCAGLEEAVAHALQHESVCSIYPMGEDPPSLVGILRAAKALGVIARERVRTGHLREGLEVLLDAIRLADDMRRGRPALLLAMVGVDVNDIALGQLQGLLASDLAWPSGELEELERQALVLARSQPAPEDIPMNDSLNFARDPLEHHGWALPNEIRDETGPALRLDDALPAPQLDPARDVILRVTALSFARRRRLCTGRTREACRDAWVDELHRARREAAADGDWATLPKMFPEFGPAIVTRALYPERLDFEISYLEQLAQAEATVRALPILFVHRRLTRTQGCIDAPTLEAAIVPLELFAGFGGRVAMLSSTVELGALDVCAPAWLTPHWVAPGSLRLPLLTAYCPAFAEQTSHEPAM